MPHKKWSSSALGKGGEIMIQEGSTRKTLSIDSSGGRSSSETQGKKLSVFSRTVLESIEERSFKNERKERGELASR